MPDDDFFFQTYSSEGPPLSTQMKFTISGITKTMFVESFLHEIYRIFGAHL